MIFRQMFQIFLTHLSLMECGNYVTKDANEFILKNAQTC